ncbi:hypothetical protein HYC85_010743 [Camellia sinensis]|uniref:Uncharacterized protein n=1 Tax=Camellia sinensis TaxID=4442 RepID=A0A7J7HJA1_CAMSI|nr:hypothetical protein HYC85_010743 [Camellia sinensis]
MMRRQDQHSKLFYELSVMILNILRSPPTPIQFSDHSPAIHTPPPVSSSRRPLPPAQSMSPAGFASLLLGISLALMLCGSVTFFIGFMLMPWVIGLVMFLYVVGIVSTLSMLGRAILCHTMSPPRKEVPAISQLHLASRDRVVAGEIGDTTVVTLSGPSIICS